MTQVNFKNQQLLPGICYLKLNWKLCINYCMFIQTR